MSDVTYSDDLVHEIAEVFAAGASLPPAPISLGEGVRRGDKPTFVELAVDDHELYVVSDLHMAGGLRRDRTYSGTENFFADEAFARFIAQTIADLAGRSAKPPANRSVVRPTPRKGRLVINGDFVDFMRIMETPSGQAVLSTTLRQIGINYVRVMPTPVDQDEVNFRVWSEVLRRIGINKTPDDLRRSVDKKEKKFGLRTNDFKSVWKLERAIRGHAPVFDALASWVGAGHQLIVMNGNHDLEWYWEAVQRHLRLALATRHAGSQRSIADALTEIIPRVSFVQHGLLIGKSVYIEHGHRFDPITSVLGGPTVDQRAVVVGSGPQGRDKELNIPFGSFFNRYLINNVELDYPYIDNVRPQTGIIALLTRERFPQAIKLALHHVPLALRSVPKRYYRYFFRQIGPFALAVLGPVVLVGFLVWDHIPVVVERFQQAQTGSGLLGRIWRSALELGGRGAWVFASWVLAQIVAAAQLKKPATLEEPARKILGDHPSWDAVVMGHTHDPRQSGKSNGTKTQWFFNAGTWTPVLETSAASVRHDRTYTYVHFPLSGTTLDEGTVWRWVDEAGRPERAAVINRIDLKESTI